jgi:hypothetical protein
MRLGLPRRAIPRKRDFIRATGGRAREPVSAKLKKEVRARAKNTCEWRGCKEKEYLQFHHKNMKNDDNRPSNIVLLCPKHHIKTHGENKREIYQRAIFGNPTRARVVKKKPKTKTKKKTTRRNTSFGFRF